MRKFSRIVLLSVALVTTVSAMAGPYSPAGGTTGSTAIPVTDPNIVEWASGATIVRGLAEIDNPSLGYAYYGGASGTPYNTAPIGMPPQPQTTSYAVALGQGGTATLTFAQPIVNGPGYDFAVFSNGFTSGSLSWCKLAFVEVSSDGVNFFSFPSVSLTQTTTQVNSYGELDPTNLYDLAGKDPAGWGTPFDLSELAGVSPLLNINDVQYVRLVDAVGDINPAYATYDSQGNIINEPWPASSMAGSEGFCLAGVGVINEAPATAVWNLSSGNWVDANCWLAGVPWDGGQAVVNNGGQVVISQGVATCSELILGANSGDSGTVQMTGGCLEANTVYVGQGGTGSFTQSGGSHAISANLYLGYSSGAGGFYQLSDGNLAVGGSEYVGYGGAGTFTQNGGRHTISGQLCVGTSDGNGTYVLSGGQLIVPKVTVGATGKLMLSGGSLQGDSADASLLTGVVNSGYIEITSGTYWLASIDCPDANVLIGTVVIDAGATLWVGDLDQSMVYVYGTLVFDNDLLNEAAPFNIAGAGADTEMTLAEPAPEPVTLVIFSFGAAVMLARARRKTQKSQPLPSRGRTVIRSGSFACCHG